MTRYAVALGSNEGDRHDQLSRAVAEIGVWSDVEAVSSLYETEPVGGPEQDPFLNAVLVLASDLSPLQLLDRLQAIETDNGRVRTVKWGPRTLDLDLIATDGPSHVDGRLTLPHPLASERVFVLVPLSEVWADAEVADGLTASDALRGMDRSGIDRLAKRWEQPLSPTGPRLFVAAQLLAFVVAAIVLVGEGKLPEGQVTVTEVAGAVVAITGLIMAFISSRRLGPAMTPSPVPREGSRLVISGPYRYVRHPIYGGVILVLLGMALFLDSVYGIVVSLLLIPFFWAKSDYEERHLRMRFADYRQYRDVVRRRFIPFII